MQRTNRIINLGYNCETSFRLEDYFGKLDSYLFSWSYENDRELFLEALKNIDDVFSHGTQLEPDHMIKCCKYNIKFHPRYDLLPRTGEVTDQQFRNGLNELVDRIKHLKTKTSRMLCDGEPKVFFLKVENISKQQNIRFIQSAHTTLTGICDGNFILVAILEQNSFDADIKNLEKQNLRIRTLTRFAPVKHTDICGDISGWNRLIQEFALDTEGKLKKNIAHRRKAVIPGMIMNKLKGLLVFRHK